MHLTFTVIAILLVNYVKATFRVIYPPPWVPVLTNSITYRAEDPSLENLQIAQFHSQDAAGRYVFGFNTPDQARVEARSHDGKVRGSYSYLDPFGRTVKVEYWDNGHGFHMAEPKNSFHHIYTPEVQAARELHFHLYNQALQAALASNAMAIGGLPFKPDPDSHDYDDEDDDSGNYHPPGSQSHDKNENDSSSNNNNKVPSSSTPALPSPSTTTALPVSEFPDNLDADIFGGTDFNSNPEFPFDPSQDYYKQLEQLDDQFDFTNQPNKQVFDNEKESIIVDSAAKTYNRGFNDRSGKTFGSPINTNVRRSVSIDSTNIPDDKNIKVLVIPDEPSTDTVVESSVNKNGFFYQFQHPIYEPISQSQVPLSADLVKSQPQQFQKVKTNGPSESLHASLFGAIPIDAVHDSQISPKQDNVRNHQILPLFVNVPKS